MKHHAIELRQDVQRSIKVLIISQFLIFHFIYSEIACGEHGDHTSKLVSAIDNGKIDIRAEHDYMKIKVNNDKKLNMIEGNLKSTFDKKEKFVDNINMQSANLLSAKFVNDIQKGGVDESLELKVEEPTNTTALLNDEGILSPERYPTSEYYQFWTVLKRTLLFSRRDWVRYLTKTKS